jgi:exopolyphosphatase/guanosine-5'-triphosphate,3'-diphosphate pyrophosphatase
VSNLDASTPPNAPAPAPAPIPASLVSAPVPLRTSGRDILAALDLGTNNCRLLIARPTATGLRMVDGFSRIVRLGEGMGETGVLGEAAMGRALAALSICADKIARRKVSRGRYVATEAARRARNCAEFLERVSARTGLALEIISSREEAELTLAGCVQLLDAAVPHALVFDVGGGSAEIVWLRLAPTGGHEIVGWISLPCGVVTLTERHGSSDFTTAAYEAIVREVMAMLKPFDAEYGIRAAVEAKQVQVLGTAGTVTTISGVNLGLRRYMRSLVDGSWLALDSIYTVCRNLAASSFAERAAHPAIGRERADLVVAGCAVLEAICRTWPVPRLRVADRGVREGILYDLMQKAAAERLATAGIATAP